MSQRGREGEREREMSKRGLKIFLHSLKIVLKKSMVDSG
jgi:hypothetical protein